MFTAESLLDSNTLLLNLPLSLLHLLQLPLYLLSQVKPTQFFLTLFPPHNFLLSPSDLGRVVVCLQHMNVITMHIRSTIFFFLLDLSYTETTQPWSHTIELYTYSITTFTHMYTDWALTRPLTLKTISRSDMGDMDHPSQLRWVTMSSINSRCWTFISVCNQPATQGQLSRPSLWGR